MRCSATWPIRDVAERNYATPCPSLWHLEEKESGICVAPATYTGPCQPRFSFKNYDADMKKAFEGRCKVRATATQNVVVIVLKPYLKAYFPTSAFSALPKLQPIIWTSPLISKASGPIGPGPTTLRGMVVYPHHMIYLPSKNKTFRTQPPLAPPKAPDMTASLAAATARHLERLRDIQSSATDKRLGSIVQVRGTTYNALQRSTSRRAAFPRTSFKSLQIKVGSHANETAK